MVRRQIAAGETFLTRSLFYGQGTTHSVQAPRVVGVKREGGANPPHGGRCCKPPNAGLRKPVVDVFPQCPGDKQGLRVKSH